MASQDRWNTLGTVEPDALRDAVLELHWAVQLVASAGQTFVTPRDDDSHRAMAWDTARRSFVGASFSGGYPFRVTVRPEDLTLQIIDRTDQALGSLPLGGQTRDEAYEWLALGLAQYMGPPPPRIGRPEYDMPEHPVGGHARFTVGHGGERAALAALYGTAADTLAAIVAGRPDASPVTCWPHHFDIATLLTLETDDDGSASKTIGLGLAPMGGGYESWYWYVNLWPYPEPDALPPLEGGGQWHTDGWTGVVLTGAEVLGAPPGERAALVRRFLEGALSACTTLLED